MAAYFPKIYPDELLASVIARYHMHTRGVSHRATHFELYGSTHSRTSVNFPRNLKELHQTTKQFTGLTLPQLVHQTTLYPYYFAFAKDSTRKEVYDKMVSARAGQTHSIVLGWAPVFDKIKICPICIKSDIKTYGEAYWHRSHQLHAAHLCSIHAEPLHLAQTQYFNDYSTPLEPLTQSVQTQVYLPPLSEKTRQRLTEIAKYGESYLNGESSNQGIQPFSASGRAALRNVYPSGPVGLNMSRIERDIVDYFGDQCLQLLGLSITPGVKNGWVRNSFRHTPSPMPTKHIVFKLFIEHVVAKKLEHAIPDAYDRLPQTTWACQNPAADHYGESVVDTVYKVHGFNRTGVLGFTCSCGYTFLAKTADWDFRSQPKKIKVQEFGLKFILNVRELYASGNKISEICRRLGIGRTIVYDMLKEDYRTKPRPIPKLAWAASASKNKCSQSKKANANSMPPVKRQVDYAARDLQYVELFECAAAQIRMTIPPKRASVNHILEVAKVGYSQLVRRHYFPLSLAKLQELGESTESIRARRKAYHALQHP